MRRNNPDGHERGRSDRTHPRGGRDERGSARAGPRGKPQEQEKENRGDGGYLEEHENDPVAHERCGREPCSEHELPQPPGGSRRDRRGRPLSR